MFNWIKLAINELHSPVPQFCWACWFRLDALFEVAEVPADAELAVSVGLALKNKLEAARDTVELEIVEGANMKRGE